MPARRRCASAYLRLAKAHHPDLNPGNSKAEDRFKVVSAANDLLSDPAMRSRYDRGEVDETGQERARQPSYRDYADGEAGQRYSNAGPGSSAWRTADLGDIFGSMFHSDTNRRGPDEHYALTTPFLDAINGTTSRLTLPDARVLDVKIPPGTSDGQTLRLREQGGAGWNDGAMGDALIVIRVTPHRFFVRQEVDIRLELPVTLSEAVLGVQVEVPTPGGPVNMRIPPGSDTGKELRLRGRGVPAFGAQRAGDLYATLAVVLGKPDPALQEFLRSWQPEHPTDPRQDMETS